TYTVNTGPNNSRSIVSYFGFVVTITVGSINHPFDLSYPPPTTISASFDALASSIAFANLSKDDSVITAEIKFDISSGDPILKDFTSSITWFFTSSHKDAGIYALEAAEHFCP